MSIDERRGEVRTNSAAQGAGAHEPAKPRARAVVVAGMHRSGTSAVTRALSLFGLDLPKNLYEPRYDNPLGYWEPRRVIDAHDAFLESIGSSFDDVLPLPEGALQSEAARTLEARLLEILAEEYGASTHFVVKDPRICRLVPIWIRALSRFEAEPSFVLVVRNPLEVAASLKARRSTFSGTKSLLLWLRHVLEAEHDTRGHPRSFVAYEDLVRDWQTAMRRIAGDLSIVWPRASHAARAEVEEFLSPRQRHHAFAPEEVDARPDVVSWVREAYETLRVAAMGAELDTGTLDDVRAELARADLAFDPLIGEYRLALDRAEQERAQAEEEHSSSRADLERDLTSLHERETASREEASALRRRVEELQAEEARRVEELAARDRESADVHLEAERLSAELAARDEAAAAQRTEVLDLRAWADGLQETLLVRERELAEAQARAETLLQEVREHGDARAAGEQALARARARIQELAAERDARAAELEARSSDVAALEERAAAVEHELEAGRKALARREAELATLRLKVDQLVGDVVVRDRAVGRFEREAVRRAEELKEATERRAHAERERARERARASRLESELQLTSAAAVREKRHVEALRAREEEAASLRAEVDRLVADLTTRDTAALADAAWRDELEQESARLRTEAERLSGDLAALQAGAAARDARATQLEQELAASRAEIERLFADVASREAAAIASDARATTSEEEKCRLEEEGRRSEEERRRLADELSRVRDQSAAQAQRLAALEAELERLRTSWWARITGRGSERVAPAGAPADELVAITRRSRRRGPRAWWRSTSQLASWAKRPRRGWGYVRSYLALRGSDSFDADYYLARYPDVAEIGLNPLMHYVEHGVLEGREPTPTAGAIAEGLAGPRSATRVQLSTPPTVDPDAEAHGSTVAVLPPEPVPPSDFSDFVVVGRSTAAGSPLASLLADPEVTVFEDVLAPPESPGADPRTNFFHFADRLGRTTGLAPDSEEMLVEYLEYLRCLAPSGRIAFAVDLTEDACGTPPTSHPFSRDALARLHVSVVERQGSAASEVVPGLRRVQGLVHLEDAFRTLDGTAPRRPPRYAMTTHPVRDLGGFFSSVRSPGGGKRVRVCFVDTILQTGGAEWFATQLIERLNPAVFECSAVTYDARGSTLALRLRGMGVNIFCATSLAGESISYEEWKREGLFDLLDRLSPDIVFFSSQYLCEQLPEERLAQLPSVVRISNFHGAELEEADFSWASTVICCSSEQFEAVSRRNADRARLIKTGVDSRLFVPPGPHEREELKRQHGLEGKKLVLFVARLSDPLKRTPVFQEVVRAINARRSDVAFVVIGYFESHRFETQEEEFRRFVEAEGVRWEEDVPPWEMPALFRLADVLVSTSAEHEGLSNTVLQALAAGVVPVVTPSGGMGELVLHGETGFVAAGGEAEAIASEVERALGLPPDDHDALATRGRASVEEFFDIGSAALEYQRTFLEVHRSRPVRVAVTDGSFGVGGAEWLVAQLIRNADRREIEFHLVVHRGNSPLVGWSRDHGATVHLAPAGMTYTDWKAGGIETILRRIRPDVVMPCTVTTWPEHEPFYRLLAISQNASDAAVLGEEQYAEADFFVCVSEDVRRQLREEYRWKMTVLHNSIDVEMFAPDPVAHAATRSELGIPADAKVVLWCGRMHEARKRLDVLMDVIDRIGGDVHFLVLGYFRDGEGDKEAWRAQIAQRPNVTWVEEALPWETARFYSAADVYLSTSGFSPSDFEGLSLATAQALAAGLPVVTTRSGGQHELVEDGVNGSLVDVGDADGLIDALRDTFSLGGEALAQLRERNRRKALDGFDIRSHTCTYTRLARMLRDNVGPAVAADASLPGERLRFRDATSAPSDEVALASSFLTYGWPLLPDARAVERSIVEEGPALLVGTRGGDDLDDLLGSARLEVSDAVEGNGGGPSAATARYAAVVVDPARASFPADLEKAAALVDRRGWLIVPGLGPSYDDTDAGRSFTAAAVAAILRYLDRAFPLWSDCARHGTNLVLRRADTAATAVSGTAEREESGAWA